MATVSVRYIVHDVDAASGVHFRNDLVAGVGGNQILLDDPSGNPVELFEPHPQ